MDENFKAFDFIVSSLKDLRSGQDFLSQRISLCVTKEDLNDHKEFFKDQISELKTHLDEQDNLINGMKSEHDKNVAFRSNSLKVLAWLLGALITVGGSQLPNIVKSFQSVPHTTIVGSVIAPLAPDDGE